MKAILLVLVLLTSNGNAQDTEKDVKSISYTYSQIESKLKDFKTKLVNADGMSAEGGDATAYMKGDTIQKINLSLFGEMGKNFYSFYYKDDSLILVLFTRHQYNAPFYFDKKMAEEYGADTFFDANKTEILEYRYYLKNNEIIRSIGPENETPSPTPQDLKKETSNLIELSNELKSKI